MRLGDRRAYAGLRGRAVPPMAAPIVDHERGTAQVERFDETNYSIDMQFAAYDRLARPACQNDQNR
jgi:hypothetical protein